MDVEGYTNDILDFNAILTTTDPEAKTTLQKSIGKVIKKKKLVKKVAKAKKGKFQIFSF